MGEDTENSLGKLDPEKYEIDIDGLPREIVGPWALDKQALVRKYIDISKSARKKYIGLNNAGAAYIDLFCGPGRIRVNDSPGAMPGGPLVAFSEAKKLSPFTEIHIADANERLVRAATIRLERENAPVRSETGLASDTVSKVIAKLNPAGLHFAFLDPYNLQALPFSVLEKLARLRRIDILVHISAQDLQRNLRRNFDRENSPLDQFAPGWRGKVDFSSSDDLVIRGKILEHWRSLLKGLGMDTAEAGQLITGTGNQRLYWLALIAKNPLALEFWQKITDNKQQKLL